MIKRNIHTTRSTSIVELMSRVKAQEREQRTRNLLTVVVVSSVFIATGLVILL